jgi:hypothetical protein
MQLSGVTLARVLAFVELTDLNPRGTVYYPDLVRALVEKLRFVTFPQKIEDFDEQKGVEFLGGTWAGITVEKVTLYNNGILLDTRSSTNDSEKILSEVLEWVTDQFKLNYRAEMIHRKAYVSNFTFYSDLPLLSPTMALTKLSRELSKEVEATRGEKFDFQPIRIDIDFDRSVAQIPMAPLTIQRRSTIPFSENKYFSEAPLSTQTHIELVERYEDYVGAVTQ